MTKRTSLISDLLKSVDLYAKPVGITFKGKQKFQTTFGGFISFVIALFVVSMLGYKFNIMFKRLQTVVKKNTLIYASADY